jgi:hypothetical protein
MDLYAHAVIELETGNRFNRGDFVPDGTFEGEELQELLDGGSLSEEEYDESVEAVPPPAVIEIAGIKYVKENPDA